MANADFDWCYEKGKKEIRSLLESDHSGILRDQFELTTLKLAMVSSGSKNKTIEDYVKHRSAELKNSPILSELDALYLTHGEQDNIGELLNSFELANYWQSSLRFKNEDTALFTELHRITSKNSPFSKRDSAILWFFEEVSNFKGEVGSAQFNHSLASTHIARILGATGAEIPYTFEQLVIAVERAESELKNSYENLMQSLSAEWKLRCEENETISCEQGAMINEAIFSLSQNQDWFEVVKKTIFKDLEFEFEFPHSSEFFAVESSEPRLQFSSLADLLIYDHRYLKYRDIDRYQREINEHKDAQTIVKFHQDVESKEPYLIVDKKTGVAHILSASGEVLNSFPMETILGSDQFEDGGAGVYRLSAKGKMALALKDERGRGVRLSLVSSSSLDQVESGAFVYILPNEEGNFFKVKNGEINFTTMNRKSNYAPYNYSSKSTHSRVTVFYINDSSRRNSVSQRFVNKLTTEKKKLMELYRLDNDEYNELAKLAFGILGNESDYGRSFKYHVKESIPFVVAMLKGEGLDTSKNSRGLTQIKKVPALIEKEYGTKKEDLGDPEHAAVATLGFLADALVELKAKMRFNPDINSENQYDYLHYIYTGRSKEITGRTATPDKNIYLRQIKEASEGLLILERKDS